MMNDDDFYWVETQVRFSDIDPMRHVNNAVYANYMEDARVSYFENYLEVPIEQVTVVVANLEIDFIEPIQFGQEVKVGVQVSKVKDSSFVMEYRILGDGERAAVGESTQVYIDVSTGESSSVPDEWREKMS